MNMIRKSSLLIAAMAGLMISGSAWSADPTATPATAPATAPETAVVVRVDPPGDLSATVQLTSLPADAPVYSNRAGVCLVLDCGDGARAVEICQKTRFNVFCLAKNDADCQQTRQALDKAGFYGHRAVAVVASLQKLPVPDRYANLIVTGDPAAVNPAEIYRVLSPNGQAIVGGAGADAAKLKSTFAAAGVKDIAVSGNFVRFSGTLPTGTDEWTHFTPRPDNIHSSRETIVRPPFRTLWLLAYPDYDDKAVEHGAIANGLIVYRADVGKPDPDRYYAFDAFNGSMLWTRPVTVGHSNYRYALIDNVFYCPEGDKIVALDAYTGQEKTRYKVPAEKGGFVWLAVQNGTLYALARAQGAPPPADILGSANLACAFDIKTGQLKWKKELTPSPLMQTTALDPNGNLYFCAVTHEANAKAAHGTAVSLDGQTGNERWHIDVGDVVAKQGECTAGGYAYDRYFVWCCRDANGATSAKSFDPANGHLIHDYPGLHSWGEGIVSQLLFRDNKIYCNPTAGHTPYLCYDVETGEPAANPCEEPARDHPGTITANTIFSGGEGFTVYDLVTGKPWYDNYIRYSDFADPYVAEGLLFHLPSLCHCPHSFGGPMALQPAGQDWTPPDANENIDQRLQTGPAVGGALVDDAAEEWTAYRAGAGHTGEVKTAPDAPAKIAWSHQLSGHLTPPSFGQGLAFIGSDDGSVTALDQSSGDVKWRFLAGARIQVTPTYARGRVVFGSFDGWVYCLDAKTGQLAWRFRAAPQERYINTDSEMCSQWPIASGVVVDGNTAYCGAGLQSFDGCYLYALDLASGKPTWSRRIGDLEQRRGDPQGIMALAGDTLICPSFDLRGTTAYRKSDGQPIPYYVGKGHRFWIFGNEAIADGDVFLYGGGRLWNPGHEARPQPFSLLDAGSGWLYGTDGVDVRPVEFATPSVAPVLGKKLLIGEGAAYDRDKLQQTLKSDPTAAKKSAVAWNFNPWPDKKGEFANSLVLAGNMVLAVGETTSGKCELVAMEAQANGRELARLPLPEKIVPNSLAVSGKRTFVVTVDGKVVCAGAEK